MLVLAIARTAAADPSDTSGATETGSTAADEAGFVGEDIPSHLGVDDCAPNPDGATREQLVAKGAEFYERGEQLYLQGDYHGAVRELVSSYCTLPYYSILKDIGQAYERALDFELAIAYLRRYRRDIPDDAVRSSACAADPQDDKKNITSRITILLGLPANVSIDTNVKDAEITLENSGRVVGRARSGESFDVAGGRKYEMTITSPGYETIHQEIRAVIGKPLTMYVPMQHEHGTLHVRAAPADAKIYLDSRFLGVGDVAMPLEAHTYGLHVEAPDYTPSDVPLAILPHAETDKMIELEPLPQTGRRQLIAYAGLAGGLSGAAFGRGVNDQSSGAGFIVGAGLAIAGTYFYADDRIALGPSSLTITSSLIGAVAGNDLGLIATNNETVETTELAGVGAIVGAAAGYYAGAQTKVTSGDAALINSGALWGGIAGHLFGAVFQDGGKLTGGLGLTGLAMGTTAGILLARTFDISRKHAALIDVGGAIGILAGVSADNVLFNQTGQNIGPGAQVSAEQQERTADFALGGLAVGLIAAGVLTRTIDLPKLPTISAGHAIGSDGKPVMTVGFVGDW